MPRQARIDAPGALHHIVVRGIERRAIFEDNRDRTDFLGRLSGLLQETRTPCYAWALMSNHVHLLLRTGTVPIASIMRRVLTGYAVRFNRRHQRYGHLFQNRYKSILCEEDSYLRQLVAYIHLNPFRAGMVEDVAALNSFPFTGHSALMGKVERSWQDTHYVLALFGRTLSEARRNLREHVVTWSVKGRCPELTGGGLIRSAGGWRAVKESHRGGIRLTGDERILGSSDFVERTLKQAGEAYDRRVQIQSSGMDLSGVIAAVCRYFNIDKEELVSPTRRHEIASARGVVAHIATRYLSIAGSEVARHLKVDRSAISRAVQRVEKDQDLIETARKIVGRLETRVSQH
jgi:REP element-mobilizing transposase RayT